MFFASPAAMPASSNPSVAKKNTARMGGVLFGGCECTLSIFLLLYFFAANDSLMPTPVPGAFIRLWILPRPKKYVAGIFFPLLRRGRPLQIPPLPKRTPPEWAVFFLAETEGFEPSWDCSLTDFESAPL